MNNLKAEVKEKKECETLLFIKSFWDKNHYMPSVMEIAEGTKIPKSSVHRYVVDLTNQGILKVNKFGRLLPISEEANK